LSDVTTTYWMPGTLESRTRALIEGRTRSAADGRCVSMFGPHALTTRQPNTHAGIDDGDRRRTIMRHACTSLPSAIRPLGARAVSGRGAWSFVAVLLESPGLDVLGQPIAIRRWRRRREAALDGRKVVVPHR
jgi:hypothetical protein